MWKTVQFKGRGWVVRKAAEGATATPFRYIGPMGDMCAPDRLLERDEAEAIAMALNDLERAKQVVPPQEDHDTGCAGYHCSRCGSCGSCDGGSCICYAR